jgi:DNA-binding MarR family transcriptional regulator
MAKSSTSPGEAMFELMMATLQTSFRLRALGAQTGVVTTTGGGTWGLMRSLARGGPQTVPELARARPVARQHIQKLANELAAEGLVEFVDNPRHRRSKLLKLTASGERRYRALSETVTAFAEKLAEGCSETELRHATKALRKLSERLDALLKEQDG